LFLAFTGRSFVKREQRRAKVGRVNFSLANRAILVLNAYLD
jgi:hypothetical protein